MTIEELEVTYRQAVIDCDVARQRVSDAYKAWCAARIEAYPHKPGTIFKAGYKVPRAKIVRVNIGWLDTIEITYVMPKKDGSWGAREHKFYGGLIDVLEPAPNVPRL